MYRENTKIFQKSVQSRLKIGYVSANKAPARAVDNVPFTNTYGNLLRHILAVRVHECIFDTSYVGLYLPLQMSAPHV